jgi:hypothetical protein
MKMRDVIAHHEAVDMHCALAVVECSGDLVDQDPEGSSLVTRELSQAAEVPFGFNHHVTEIYVEEFGRENVTDIHQVILIDDANRHGRALRMLVANETVHHFSLHLDSRTKATQGTTSPTAQRVGEQLPLLRLPP